MKLYNEVDQMKEEQRKAIHKWKPLQEEAIKVLEELATT
jgi:hypothetical protein